MTTITVISHETIPVSIPVLVAHPLRATHHHLTLYLLANYSSYTLGETWVGGMNVNVDRVNEDGMNVNAV